AEAHRVDIVHRDIKPANVLIDGNHAYLSDFGIARSLTHGRLTRTGAVVGTLDYLAPEQARGQEVDGRADIYALGLLLYEMLSGVRPFSGETADEILAQRVLAAPPDISATGVTVPVGVRNIVRRCLQVDPDDRYQSAAELARDLQERRVTAFRLKRRARGIIAAAAILVAALAVWSTLPDGTPTDRQAASPAAALSLAMLPFGVATDDADRRSISIGLAELMSDKLAESPDLRVIDIQRVHATLRDLKMQGDELTISDKSLLGDLLDAEFLVTGRLQQIGASYRLEARMQKASSGETVHKAAAEVLDANRVFVDIETLAAELLDDIDATPRESGSAVYESSPETLRAYAEGVNLLSQGNALDALQPLHRAVELSPDFALAWDRLGQALARLGRDRDALLAADKAVAYLPEGAGRAAAMVRARHAALAGNFDEAKAELDRLLENFPADNDARFMLAEMHGESGALGSARQLLTEVVVASPDHPQAWYLLGKYAILQGDAARAASDYLIKALVIQNRLANVQGRADVTNALGIAQAELGNLEQAAEYYREAAKLRESIGDDRGVATALANLASIQTELGSYDDARNGLLTARAKLVEIGDQWTVANLTNELGFVEEHQGRFDEALTRYRDALRMRRDLGDQRALAESHNNVGFAYYLLGEYDSAAVFNEQALAIYSETGNAEGIMLASQTRGILEIARGRFESALKALLESLRLSRELGDETAAAIANGYIARARHMQARYAASASLYEETVRTFRNIGDDRGVAEFTLYYADLMLDLGLWDAAAGAIDEARSLLARDQNRARLSLLLRIDAEYQAATGERPAAGKLLERALAEAKESGARTAILETELARAALDGGSIEELGGIREASAHLGHGPLQLETGIALGSALVQSGRYADAVTVLRETLALEAAGPQFNGDFRAHALLADALQATGQNDPADDHRKLARLAVERAIGGLAEAGGEAFASLEAVRAIMQQPGGGNDR
ncbi:MAG: tetratricopeptide repeat protein, partial [Woeseiaceae bacterium]